MRIGGGTRRNYGSAVTDAPSVIDAGRASGGVGLRNLSGEQAKDQQAGSNVFHG
jgi:hypothetical protein